jgi:hypothetical protein
MPEVRNGENFTPGMAIPHGGRNAGGLSLTVSHFPLNRKNAMLLTEKMKAVAEAPTQIKVLTGMMIIVGLVSLVALGIAIGARNAH